MDKNALNLGILLILAMAFFLAATLEFTHGYRAYGVLFTVALMITLSKIRMGRKIRIDSTREVKSKLYAVAGVLIIISDLVYNYTAKDPIKTLDMMTLILGSSLIACSMSSVEVRRFGFFGASMSFSFLVLYRIFYGMFDEYTLMYKYYFIVLPSVNVAKAVGIPIDIVSFDVVRIQGIDFLISSTCSGINSMILLVSLVIGYSFVENLRDVKKIFLIAILAAFVAYVANFLRVSLLYLLDYRYGLELMKMVHVHLGWIIFAINSLLIFYMLSKLTGYVVDVERAG